MVVKYREQLVLGLGYQFWPKKGQKTKFLDQKIVAADDKMR